MQTVTTAGLDTAKSVFHVHCVAAGGQVIIRRQLKRRYVLAFFQKLPPCLIGIEACASSHYWSRELQALGHTVRLMPAAMWSTRTINLPGDVVVRGNRTVALTDAMPGFDDRKRREGKEASIGFSRKRRS